MAKRTDSNSSRVGVHESSELSAGPSEYDMAYQNYIASAYLRGMYEKRYREMSEAAIEELSELMSRTREEILAAIMTKERVCRALGAFEAINTWNEAAAIALPAAEAYSKGIAVMEKTLKNVERTLNQLPIEEGVTFCENDAEKLDSTVELLSKNLEECLSGLESVEDCWVQFADIVQDMSQEDLVLRKNRCDDLMKEINDATLKISSLRAAKTARETLNN